MTKTLLKWIGLAVISLLALAVLSPEAGAQLNRISVNQIVGILSGAKGGTGSAFFTVSGPTVARTYTFPDASTTALTTNAAVTTAQGGTGVGTLTSHGVLLGNGTGNVGATAECATGTLVYGQTGANPICSTLTVPNAAATGTFLIATGTNALAAVAPALSQAEPADQTARSSSGGIFVMMGLGAAAAPCTVTPASTGRVVFIITGDLVNNTTATTVSIKMAESTGTAPANNAAASGTVISRTLITNAVTSVLTTPFTLTATKTGLALATAVWFDLQLTTSGANTGQPTNIDCTAHEI